MSDVGKMAANLAVVSDSELIAQAIAETEAAAPDAQEPQETTAPEPKQAAGKEPEAEAKAPEETEAPKESVARGWAAIKQKDKEMQRARAQLKEEQTSIEARTKEIDALKEQYAQSLAKLKSDPLAALKEMGVTFDDLTHRVLHDGAQSSDEKVRRMETETQKQLRELQERYEQLESSVKGHGEESVRAQQQQVLAQYQRETMETLNDDAFPFLMAEVGGDKGAAAQEVLAVAQYIAQQQEKVLTPQEAAGMIEAELVRKYEALHKRGVFERLNKSDSSASSHQGKSNLPAGNKPKTITNSNTASRTDAEPVDLSRMTDREQIEYALKFVG